MQACIITSDTLAYDVVFRSMKEFGVSDVSMGSAETFNDNADIFIIDLDLATPDVFDISRRLKSQGLIVIAMGSKPARVQEEKNELWLSEHLLRKPFSQERLIHILEQNLITKLDKLVDREPKNIQNRSETVRSQWENLCNDIEGKATRVRFIMTASPKQLKAEFAKNIEIKDDGNVSVSLNDIPVKHAIIIERDAAYARNLTQYLAKKCVLQVDIAPDIQEGWDKIQDENYDLIILNWDLKDSEALGLYNRLRSAPKYRFIPIIVMSNVIEAREFRLLDEDFCIAAVGKPVQEQKFSEVLACLSLAKVMTTEFLPELSKAMNTAIKENLLTSLVSDLKESKQILLNALKVCGDAFLSDKDYSNAEIAYSSAWNLGDRRLSLTTGLAKALFLTKRPEQAKKLLHMSDVIAPGSIERIGLLGEVALALDDPQSASAYFEAVLKIDPTVKKAQAGINVAENFLNYDGRNNGLGFASYLNVVGIGLAQSGKTQEALYYYKSAMQFVYDPESLAKLWFNVGISLLRMGRKQSAQKAFKKAALVSERLSEKVAKYLRNPGANANSEEFGFEKI